MTEPGNPLKCLKIKGQGEGKGESKKIDTVG